MSGAFSREYEEAGQVPGQPIPIRPAVPEAGEYPVDALSPKLRAATLAILEKVQLPAALAASSVMAAAALAVQPFIDVVMPTGEVVPTSLFMVSVGASGERKSSADKLALRGVRERERELHKDFARDQAGYLADVAAYSAAKKKAMGGNKSRQQIRDDIERCGAEPIAPPVPVLISDEGTLQGLQKAFAEAMPSLGLFSDEGGQWLGGYSMGEEQRGATGAGLSKMWDGAPIKRVRGGDGVSILRGRRLSLHLMVQHRIARRLFGDPDLKDQGLLSRLLICQPKSKKGFRPWHDASEDAALDLEKYDARILGLLRGNMPMDPETRELTPARIGLSAEAKELFVQWHDAVERELRPNGAFEEISGFAAKLPEHSVRIAAVMAFFEDRNMTEISAQALACGIKIAKYHAAEALRLFGLGDVDADTENAAAMIEWIRQQKLTVVGARYLSRHGPGRTLTAPVRKRAISLLEEMKHLIPITGGANMEADGKFYRDAYTVIAEPDDE